MSAMFEQFKNPDGTYDGTRALEAVSGIPRTEIVSMWAEVKANRARLEACLGHDFSIEGEEKGAARRRTCSRCGGKLGLSEVIWYEMGLAHAGGRAA